MRGSVSLSYTRAREMVLSAFDSIGLPKQDYGLHKQGLNVLKLHQNQFTNEIV